MSNIIKVRLVNGNNEHFVVTDPDTGHERTYPSTLIHTPEFIVDLSVKNFFLNDFPGKSDWEITPEAQERINAICDFNCLDDVWPDAE